MTSVPEGVKYIVIMNISTEEYSIVKASAGYNPPNMKVFGPNSWDACKAYCNNH